MNFKNRYLKYFLSAFILLGIFTIIYYTFLYQPKIDFNTQVRPILNAKCTACHGGVKKAGNISFIYREEALGKGKSGKVCIAPGDAAHSEFIARLTHHDKEIRMPLNKEKLSDEEIKILTQWVNEGAEWQDHWAFIKPQLSPIPSADWGNNFIDNFVIAKADNDEIDLKPAAEADKVTLIRRASLDIIGLPPTSEEVNQFLQDKSANAYEKVIDRLLASPSYGERWTALWLDLARYADSKGYEKDQARNIWRYRDYLIQAFNEDKKYDQFTIEQLAGDLLPKPTEQQILATAFHRNTLNNDEGGTEDEEFRTAAILDRLNTTFDVWQGITVGCTQCHSHPYDPIRHKEYYQLLDFFNQTKDCDNPDETPVYFSKNDFDLEKAKLIASQINALEHKQGLQAMDIDIKKMRRAYLSWLKVTDCDVSSNVRMDEKKIMPLKEGAFVGFKNVKIPESTSIAFGYRMPNNQECDVEVRLDKPNGKVVAKFNLQSSFNEWYFKERPLISNISGEHDVYFVFNKGKNGTLDGGFSGFSFKPKNKEPHLKDSLRQELSKCLNSEGTPILTDLPKHEARTTRIFVRGSFQNLADTVSAAVPEVFHKFPTNAPANRLGLAQWLVSKNNPLTARVAVNRYWEQLFGTGLVETLEDFGSQGNKPTHPALLDNLALYFMNDCDWSMKKLLKTIVMSATYKQSSIISKDALAIDPKNKYLLRGARFRLTTEQIRDQSLAVSGLLSKKMYGPSVMPAQPEGIWQTVYSGATWTTSKGEDAHRRAIYTYIRRSAPYPSFITFDNPSREFCVVRRIRTNTPLQALVTLNDTVYNEVAFALAKEAILKNSTNTQGAIAAMYAKALHKAPNINTLAVLKKLYTQSYAKYSKQPKFTGLVAYTPVSNHQHKIHLLSMAVVASAIVNLDEFITKE